MSDLRKGLKLTLEDADTIMAYIRAEQKNYTGPVYVSLDRLEQIHMERSKFMAHILITNARYASRPQQGRTSGNA